MVAQAVLDQCIRSGRRRRGDPDEHRHRLHLHQGPTLGLRWKGGDQAQEIGLSRGGKTTKIHALTDTIGRPFRLRLTAGNVSDIKAAPSLLGNLAGAKHLLADKGYDADHLRQTLRGERIRPVIPGRSNRKRPVKYDKQRYKERHLIENAFCRIKDFRRVATRYDKLAANFLSTVALACLLGYWL
jgi:transposase